MKSGYKVVSDVDENEGLRVSFVEIGAKFFYRYISSITYKLCQIKISKFAHSFVSSNNHIY
jgi:hypothetical protein